MLVEGKTGYISYFSIQFRNVRDIVFYSESMVDVEDSDSVDAKIFFSYRWKVTVTSISWSLLISICVLNGVPLYTSSEDRHEYEYPFGYN